MKELLLKHNYSANNTQEWILESDTNPSIQELIGICIIDTNKSFSRYRWRRIPFIWLSYS